MNEYLVFRLYGPMASWGELAVGESRHSAVYPSKSALIGLLSAALGIPREDEAAQEGMARGYRFAVKLMAQGHPLRDFHSVQAAPQQKKARIRSRREELSDRERLGTLLSMREYRCDSLAVVVAEALPAAPYVLAALACALERPQFPLFLGRKSCPLAAPLGARLISAASVSAAFDAAPMSALASLGESSSDVQWPSTADRQLFQLDDSAVRYFWENGMHAGMEATFKQDRHDQPESRRRWQFSRRIENVRLAGETQ